MAKPNRNLSSRELLNRIGLNEESSDNLLQDENLDDLLHGLDGDLGSVLLERYALLNTSHASEPVDLGVLEARAAQPSRARLWCAVGGARGTEDANSG